MSTFLYPPSATNNNNIISSPMMMHSHLDDSDLDLSSAPVSRHPSADSSSSGSPMLSSAPASPRARDLADADFAVDHSSSSTSNFFDEAGQKRQAQTPLASAMDPRQRYVLHKELQKSIYGKMYMGVDVTTDQPVAIKVSVKRLLESHRSLSGVTVLEDPREEVRLMTRVAGHPNVVSLVAVHEDADLHWMAQEFVGGGDLFDALAAAGSFSAAEACSIFGQVMAGLSHMHARGVAHLDISLENLLVDTDGTVKICDFGLARVMDDKPGSKLPNGPNRPGKYGYMAPEVLSGQDFDGAKADVFSAGVVLFSLLTGHPPFEHAGLQDRRYHMIAHGKVVQLLKLTQLDHLVPEAAAQLITGMLHPNPERRLSVQQVLEHPWMQGQQ